MREFQDDRGAIWVASVEEREGDDYKGRFILKLRPRDGTPDQGFLVEDVRWNSPKTAERTLKTMAKVELLRRLRIALGRQQTRAPA